MQTKQATPKAGERIWRRAFFSEADMDAHGRRVADDLPLIVRGNSRAKGEGSPESMLSSEEETLCRGGLSRFMSDVRQ